MRDHVRHLINDGLMALFFFVVGLEIKRELRCGKLAGRHAAALPGLAAAGGAMWPALLFTAILAGAGRRGVGDPHGHRHRVAIGVLALLGDRVSWASGSFSWPSPWSTASIAIAVIALFYSKAITVGWLLGALGGLAVVVALRRLGVTSIIANAAEGLAVVVRHLLVASTPQSAGVALGLTPVGRFVGGGCSRRPSAPDLQLRGRAAVCARERGRPLGGGPLERAATSRLVRALVVGKLVGIAATTRATLGLGAGALPQGAALRDVSGLAALGGIGFTISLFIAGLAFESRELQHLAKAGIFVGSILSRLLGAALLVRRARPRAGGPRSGAYTEDG